MYLFGNVPFSEDLLSSLKRLLALNTYLDTEQGNCPTKGNIMKKSYAIAMLLSVFAVSSFAQDASTIGARRVAERDAAYAKSHPVVIQKTALTPQKSIKHKSSKNKSSRPQKQNVVTPKAAK